MVAAYRMLVADGVVGLHDESGCAKTRVQKGQASVPRVQTLLVLGLVLEVRDR